MTDLTPDLRDLVDRLLISDLQQRLPGAAAEVGRLSEVELARLLGAASLLSFSGKLRGRALAYEIATRVLLQFKEPPAGVVKVVELLLARLGNFPGRKLLHQRYRARLAGAKGSALLRLEATIRQWENSVPDAAGKSFAVTDFQYKALEIFTAHSAVSVSAPTSAGKSFVMTLHMIRKLQSAPGCCIV